MKRRLEDLPDETEMTADELEETRRVAHMFTEMGAMLSTARTAGDLKAVDAKLEQIMGSV